MDDELDMMEQDGVAGGEEPVDLPVDDEEARERESNRDLLERLRLALLASDPDIEPELVRGDTADEIEASFRAAQRLVAGIRESVKREQAAAIPAGAPGRVVAGPVSAYE